MGGDRLKIQIFRAFLEIEFSQLFRKLGRKHKIGDFWDKSRKKLGTAKGVIACGKRTLKDDA